MSIQQIQESVKGVIQYYTENPEKAISEDKPATAKVEEGLRCRAIRDNGVELVSDMPKGNWWRCDCANAGLVTSGGIG